MRAPKYVSWRGFTIAILAINLWAHAEVPIDKPLTIAKLRQYCQACHGVDNLRFLDSEDDEAVWKKIYTDKAPNSQKLWVNAIIEVLSWPTNSPPPFQQPINAGKDWMPKGYKRIALAKDQQGEFSTRNIILETLKNYQFSEASPTQPSREKRRRYR